MSEQLGGQENNNGSNEPTGWEIMETAAPSEATESQKQRLMDRLQDSQAAEPVETAEPAKNEAAEIDWSKVPVPEGVRDAQDLAEFRQEYQARAKEAAEQTAREALRREGLKAESVYNDRGEMVIKLKNGATILAPEGVRDLHDYEEYQQAQRERVMTELKQEIAKEHPDEATPSEAEMNDIYRSALDDATAEAAGLPTEDDLEDLEEQPKRSQEYYDNFANGKNVFDAFDEQRDAKHADAAEQYYLRLKRQQESFKGTPDEADYSDSAIAAKVQAFNARYYAKKDALQKGEPMPVDATSLAGIKTEAKVMTAPAETEIEAPLSVETETGPVETAAPASGENAVLDSVENDGRAVRKYVSDKSVFDKSSGRYNARRGANQMFDNWDTIAPAEWKISKREARRTAKEFKKIFKDRYPGAPLPSSVDIMALFRQMVEQASVAKQA
ncbi:MAG: hypothetical protein LBM12_02040 [Candidatus Nomurabacteria bacterium]|nr:hypothetical protein [Candidatus Nomurabacteria bacterium]